MHQHHHGHGHHHNHHGGGEGGERRLLVTLALNLFIAAAQFVAGLISGSLALLSDALHNATDASSLGVSYGARRISRRRATATKTFGYRRAEIIGAFLNLIVLVFIAVYLIIEAAERFMSPQPVDGTIMIWLALLSVFVNVLCTGILYRDAKDSLNVRSAVLHLITDAVSSVAVFVGGVLILLYQVYWVDPLLTVGIAAYILVHSYGMLRETVDILMESPPRDLDLGEVITAVEQIEHVEDMHHLHVWRLDDRRTALEAHILIDRRDLDEMESVKQAVKKLLEDRFHIAHTTLEFEFEPCEAAADEKCF